MFDAVRRPLWLLLRTFDYGDKTSIVARDDDPQRMMNRAKAGDVFVRLDQVERVIEPTFDDLRQPREVYWEKAAPWIAAETSLALFSHQWGIDDDRATVFPAAVFAPVGCPVALPPNPCVTMFVDAPRRCTCKVFELRLLGGPTLAQKEAARAVRAQMDSL